MTVWVTRFCLLNSLLCLLSAGLDPAISSTHENTWVETSAFTERWQQVPAPGALTKLGRIGSDPGEVGSFQFALALVDMQGKLSPMSDPVTVQMTLRNGVIVAGLPNYPTWTQASGWILFSRMITPFVDPAPPAGIFDGDWRPYGVQPNAGAQNAARPILPICGVHQHLFRNLHIMHRLVRWYPGGAFPVYSDNTFWPKSQILTEKPALPPIVQVHQFPNVQCEIAVSFATNLGESPLSPALTFEQTVFTPNTHHQNVPMSGFHSGVRFKALTKRETGALGYYVYAKIQEPNGAKAKWIRQPAQHVVGNPTTPDDYLWPLAITEFALNRYVATGPAPGPSGPAHAQSLISPLQQALDSGTKHVLVTDNQEIKCPIVHELYNGHGTTIGRHVKGPHELPWKITTSSSAGGPSSWPIWCEAALKTKIFDCGMFSTHCRSGIDFATVYDSSNFSFHTQNLSLGLQAPGYTAGIIQRWESVSNNGHHTSETMIGGELTMIQAAHPIVIEGNQAANWRFKGELHLHSTGGIHSALITCNNYMNINQTGELICAGSPQTTQRETEAAFFNWPYNVWADPDAFVGGRAIAAMVNCGELQLSEIFVDQGFPEWIVCGSYGGKRIRFGINNVNQWANNLAVLTNANGSKVGTIFMEITGTSSRHSNPMAAVVAAGRPGYITIKKPDELGILSNLVKYEPIIVP